MTCEHHGGRVIDSCIHQVPLFQGLSNEELALLTDAVQSSKYRKGDFVFREAEASNALYVVKQGVVKVSRFSESGKEHILRFLFQGDYGDMSSLFREGLHYADAEVVEDAVICRIYRGDLAAIMNHHPNMATRFLAAMSERLHDADDWVSSICLSDAEQRLAKILLLFSGREAKGGPLRLPVSKKDLASLIGVTPETVSRKLALFESAGMILLSGKKGIEMIDVPALEQIAGVCSI